MSRNKILPVLVKLAGFITPAVKYPKLVIPAYLPRYGPGPGAGHAVKLLRYPERDWMPDQVRHDGVGYIVARFILKIVK